MADQIVPRTIFEFADELETETIKFKTCFGLMREALQFGCSDPNEARLAQERLYFLTSAMDGTRERLEALTAAAYQISFAEKATG